MEWMKLASYFVKYSRYIFYVAYLIPVYWIYFGLDISIHPEKLLDPPRNRWITAHMSREGAIILGLVIFTIGMFWFFNMLK
jgi:hypothetical protein